MEHTNGVIHTGGTVLEGGQFLLRRENLYRIKRPILLEGGCRDMYWEEAILLDLYCKGKGGIYAGEAALIMRWGDLYWGICTRGDLQWSRRSVLVGSVM